MWEAALLCSALSVATFGRAVICVRTGLPLGFGVLAVAWCIRALPPSVYLPRPTVVGVARDVVAMVACTDLAQYCIHRWSHARRSRSHALHHVHTHPRSTDAFRTGVADACVQLMVPILLSLWAVRPERVSTTVFGVGYALWLQFIHSDSAWCLAFRSTLLVTPSFHRLHHTKPHRNFGHVLTIWDVLGKTAETP